MHFLHYTKGAVAFKGQSVRQISHFVEKNGLLAFQSIRKSRSCERLSPFKSIKHRSLLLSASLDRIHKLIKFFPTIQLSVAFLAVSADVVPFFGVGAIATSLRRRQKHRHG